MIGLEGSFVVDLGLVLFCWGVRGVVCLFFFTIPQHNLIENGKITPPKKTPTQTRNKPTCPAVSSIKEGHFAVIQKATPGRLSTSYMQRAKIKASP